MSTLVWVIVGLCAAIVLIALIIALVVTRKRGCGSSGAALSEQAFKRAGQPRRSVIVGLHYDKPELAAIQILSVRKFEGTENEMVIVADVQDAAKRKQFQEHLAAAVPAGVRYVLRFVPESAHGNDNRAGTRNGDSANWCLANIVNPSLDAGAERALLLDGDIFPVCPFDVHGMVPESGVMYRPEGKVLYMWVGFVGLHRNTPNRSTLRLHGGLPGMDVGAHSLEYINANLDVPKTICLSAPRDVICDTEELLAATSPWFAGKAVHDTARSESVVAPDTGEFMRSDTLAVGVWYHMLGVASNWKMAKEETLAKRMELWRTHVDAPADAKVMAQRRLRSLGITNAVVWGHPLHSHTHSYIHAAFAKAFEALGLPTVHVPVVADAPDGSLQHGKPGEPPYEIPDNAVVVVEGAVAGGLPINPSAWYIAHNCDAHVVNGIAPSRLVTLQVVTNDSHVERATPVDGSPVQRLGPDGALFMSWATDLLPEEFTCGDIVPIEKRRRAAVWRGTHSNNGIYENRSILDPFFEEATRIMGLAEDFKLPGASSFEEVRNAVADSLVAPAIVGPWQERHGYIPCRLFKNVSYGALPVTNSEYAAKAFGKDMGLVMLQTDPRKLAAQVKETLDDPQGADKRIRAACMHVRVHHTFYNRIAALVFAFGHRA